jgi:hypothetical protein
LFGYIQPLKSELKVRELEVFKSYYCSLCKILGKRCGKKSQFLVNYDCAFLGLLLDSLSSNNPEFYVGRCSYNPLKKKMLIKNNPAIDYAADINMILSYLKLKDDVSDKKLTRLPLLLLYARKGKQTAKRLGSLSANIDACIAELSLLERENCDDLDQSANPTANMLRMIFQGYTDVDSLGEIGYNLGRWVYFIDAVDDMLEDKKKNNYNVFNLKYKDHANTASMKEDIEFLLQFSLAKAAEAFDKLPLSRNEGLLSNIIYAGVLHKTDEVLKRSFSQV